MMMRAAAVVAMVWVGLVVGAGCESEPSAPAPERPEAAPTMRETDQNKLALNGSTTVGPIVDAFAEAFMGQYPDFEITVTKTGSGDGAKALLDGHCDIAPMSRFMKEKEFKTAADKGILPVAHAVAMDGVCVSVHPSNPVSALSADQIRDIYQAKITNWKDLGGPDRAIVAISRDTSSGTYEVFHDKVMAKQEMAGGVQTVSGNPDMHATIAANPAAIGYLGYGFVDENVKALEVNGVAPTPKTIASGKYPVARPLFLFTAGYPKLGSKVFLFCTFHLTEEGEEIVEAKGFIPMTQ